MTAQRWISLGLLFGMWTASARAEELQWRPAQQPLTAAPPSAASVPVGHSILGAPIPLGPQVDVPPPDPAIRQTSFQPVAFPTYQDNMVIRAQAPGSGVPPVPPPAFPGAGGAPLGAEDYNCANVVTPAGGQGVGGFWNSIVSPTAGRKFLQSDHCYDTFISPVTNPTHFEDPRALTEVRPTLIWQSIPGANPGFGGGNVVQFILQGRLALTDWFSVTVNQLGATYIDPNDSTGVFNSATGFSELQIGPKFTFLRNDNKGTFFGPTLMAAGLIFELPVGASSVFQDTGSLSLRPYVSFGQQFGQNTYGAFHFLSTAGYSFAVDGERSDHFFLSGHLDFDIANQHRWYPFVEMNYYYYARNGDVRNFNFEGRDLFNFGSRNVAGVNELAVAVGGRIKFTEAFQFGAAAEFPLLGDQNLMDFRVTVDFIFRY